MTRVRLEYSLQWLGPWHVGSGEGSVGQADRLVVRDARGNPYLPGASLKGAVRTSAERVAGALALRSCGAAACRDTPCLMCRLFGSSRQPGPLRFGDACRAGEVADGVFDPYRFEVRFGVQICRQRRIALERHLYTTEFARLDGERLRGSILGHVADINAFGMDLPPTLWALLCSLQMTERLGGQRSRGAGHVAVSIEEFDLENVPDPLGLWQRSLSDHSAYQDYVVALQEETQ